jgi:16S rRNA (guanine527-N7)-methyltransferase
VSAVPPALRAVLEAGQRRGAVGPGALDDAVRHAEAFFTGLHPEPGWRCIDLGSGGGLPGLPLALAHPATTWTLVDAWEARVVALDRAIRTLELGDRVTALHARAEELARGPMRGSADVVAARSFGPAAATAECAAPLLRVGGLLIVSVPADGDQWPADGVPELGLAVVRTWEAAGGRYRMFRATAPAADRFPRRPAAQRRRPVF